MSRNSSKNTVKNPNLKFPKLFSLGGDLNDWSILSVQSTLSKTDTFGTGSKCPS